MRLGADATCEPDKTTGQSTHKLRPVYQEMLVQVCRDFPTLPDPRTLTMGEIRFFYESLRAELRERTKPRAKTRP